MTAAPPAVPSDRLADEGWVEIDRTESVLADLPVVTVEGTTLVYSDDRLREQIAQATDPPIDRSWRFFFATKLSLDPSPPPGVGPKMFASIVRSQANKAFAERLRDRGCRAVEQREKEEIRVRTGETAKLTSYTGQASVDRGGQTHTYPVEGWVGVWHHDGSFRVAGGAYPTGSLSEIAGVGIDISADKFRTDLFELLRAVA